MGTQDGGSPLYYLETNSQPSSISTPSSELGLNTAGDVEDKCKAGREGGRAGDADVKRKAGRAGDADVKRAARRLSGLTRSAAARRLHGHDDAATIAATTNNL